MKNVLLVDDDKVFNFLSEKIIQQLGFVAGIHTALNGEEAITLINEYFVGSLPIPDIILLDLNMPVMDGFSFIEAFRRLHIPGIENVKIIIVTSSDNPNDIVRAKELCIIHYLRKPIDKSRLSAALIS
jgi:CheY-like chemotaxis protein